MSMPPRDGFRYKAFISYNHRDSKFAKKLHARLENFSFSSPQAKGDKNPLFPIFLDNSELKAGSNLSDAIQDAIASSEYLIVICSKNAAASHWVKAEISLMREINENPKIIGVIADKEGDETHLAALLGNDIEHLAADFRPGKNKHLQLSKIAATILNVELDELYQRESRRKNKQMMTLGGGLAIIATLMTGMAAHAYLSEKEAVRQRQQSEEVIAFMIDEFRGDLEKLDKLELLTDVGIKAEEYFNDRDLSLLSDNSVILQSRTLRQLGEVDEKRGKIGLAKQRIIGASAASELMIKRRPNSKDAISEHAENSDYWGYLEYQLGHLEKAQTLFETAKSLFETGAKNFPDDTDMAWKNMNADLNIGIMILQQGRAAEARPYIERTLLAVEARYEANELNEDQLYEYANMYTWYIRSLPDDTPLSFLFETRAKQLTLYEDMRASGARTISNQSEKLNVERAVVILLLYAGRDTEAEALMLNIQSEFSALLDHDPENVGWRRHLMRSKLTLGLLYDKKGQKNDRNRELEEALKLGEKPNGEKWGLTTDIDRRMNRLKAYRLFEEDSLDTAMQSLATDQKKITDYWKGNYNPRVRYNLASYKNFEAELLTKEGRTKEAKTAQRRVLELLSEKDSYTIAEQILRLKAFEDLEMVDEERLLRAKLENRGLVLD